MKDLIGQFTEGDIGVYGIAVLIFFFHAVFRLSSVAVCGFSSFFTVSRYRSFLLSSLIQVNTLSKTML